MGMGRVKGLTRLSAGRRRQDRQDQEGGPLVHSGWTELGDVSQGENVLHLQREPALQYEHSRGDRAPDAPSGQGALASTSTVQTGLPSALPHRWEHRTPDSQPRHPQDATLVFLDDFLFKVFLWSQGFMLTFLPHLPITLA